MSLGVLFIAAVSEGEQTLMDFKSVLSLLLKKFNEENINYALMGGFALGLWGVGKTTVDIDFLVRREDMNGIDSIMHDAGYECKYSSENVSQYVSPLKVFGEVDFLHAFREASIEMLNRAEEKEIFDEPLKITVLKPEDLIGLKLQAIKNDPLRLRNDMADIESLINIHARKLDLSLLKKYFRIFDMEDLYKKLIKEQNK